MTTHVTLNVFSGRTNPSWLLSDSQEDQLKGRLAADRQVTDRRPSGSLGRLGYRGFSLSRHLRHPKGPLSALVHEGIIDDHLGAPNTIAGPGLEAWLLTTAPGFISKAVTDHVGDQLGKTLAARVQVTGGCPACNAADAPVYAPTTWNVPSVQPYNNCYNYANNRITNTFAQPGRATGHQYTQFTCANVQAASASDGLTVAAGFAAPLSAGQGFYVALVIWPGEDFHWYRQDTVGCWSHKPGSDPVTNLDNANKQIENPQSCDRGPYTDFCCFMVTTSSVQIN